MVPLGLLELDIHDLWRLVRCDTGRRESRPDLKKKGRQAGSDRGDGILHIASGREYTVSDWVTMGMNF